MGASAQLEHHLAIKNKVIMNIAGKWVDIILNEVAPSQKDTYGMFSPERMLLFTNLLPDRSVFLHDLSLSALLILLSLES